MWSSNSEVFITNLKAVVMQNVQDDEVIAINSKQLGVLQMLPKFIRHSQNG